MDTEFSQKTVRRLTAAEGYLELNMPEYALDELQAIENPGALEPAVCWLKGETLKAQRRYDEAIEPLQQAARTMPEPHNKRAWLSLSECFRRRGQTELADLAESFADASDGAATSGDSVPSPGSMFGNAPAFRRGPQAADDSSRADDRGLPADSDTEE